MVIDATFKAPKAAQGGCGRPAQKAGGGGAKPIGLMGWWVGGVAAAYLKREPTPKEVGKKQNKYF